MIYLYIYNYIYIYINNNNGVLICGILLIVLAISMINNGD